jgi:hypothetical protein
VQEILDVIQNGKAAKGLGLTSTPTIALDYISVTKDGVYGSTDIDAIIKKSHWDIITPDVFK